VANPDAWEIRVTNDNRAEVFALPLAEVTAKGDAGVGSYF
jgi:hypothetical protein